MQVISGFIKRVIESFIQTIPSNGRFIKNETDVCAWVIESLNQRFVQNTESFKTPLSVAVRCAML